MQNRTDRKNRVTAKADAAIQTAEEITGKEYTDEQKETIRNAYEEYDRITEEANRQAFEAYQESQKQFQQKIAEEAQQARAYDRVMAEETQQTQEEAQQRQQTQQETKQELYPVQLGKSSNVIMLRNLLSTIARYSVKQISS